MPRTLILTDIHGCNLTLQRMLEQLELTSDDHLCFLGDYIDRGPDSKGVVDTILDLNGQVARVTCLAGNHEELLLEALEGDQFSKVMWTKNGGDTTLASFGASDAEELDEKYLTFFRELDAYAEVDHAILVHAGLSFEGDPLQDESAMRWSRNWYSEIDYDWLGGRIIIHGHTPQPQAAAMRQRDRLSDRRYLNLDTGCVYDRPELGYLTAFQLETEKLFFQKRVDAI